MFFLANGLLGYNRLTPHLHYEMCLAMEQAGQYKRFAMIVPRDHYKTTIASISYPIWRGIRDPNETGLIVSNTATNAQKIVGRIKTHWEQTTFLRQLFPELCPEHSTRWNKNEVCLPRTIDWPEATWEPAGWDTAVTMRHFDYMVMDDINDENTAFNPELMMEVCKRFEQREGLLRPPIHERTIILVMNCWSVIDMFHYIRNKHPEYRIYYRQAIENGVPIFPECYSLEWLLRKQASDPYTFATQFMNNPTDPQTTEFKPEHRQEYTKVTDGLKLPDGTIIPFGKLNIYAGVDPRHSIATTPAEKMTSKNAIVIAGVDSYGHRVLLDYYAKRSDPGELVAEMLRLHQQWHPLQMGVEGYGYQKSLAILAPVIWKDLSDRPNIVLCEKDSKKSKPARIRSGLQFFRDGNAFIHRSHVEFKEEFDAFPNGLTSDLLDAWTWACTLMAPPEDDVMSAEEQAQDERYYNSLQSLVGM